MASCAARAAAWWCSSACRDALRDGDPIWAVIRGSAVNQDGRCDGLTAPNGLAQQAVLRAALAQAQVAPADGRATSKRTAPAPRSATRSRWRRWRAVFWRAARRRWALLAGLGQDQPRPPRGRGRDRRADQGGARLHHGAVPPHLHFRRLNPRHQHRAGRRSPIPTALTPWPAAGQPRRAAVSAFGMSGTNAHLILEAAPARAHCASSRPRAPTC